jgi:hypothetical protein
VRHLAETGVRKPYGYESNRLTLAWFTGALAAWVLLALVTAWHDNNSARMLETWQARGFRTVPTGQSSLNPLVVLDYLVVFAAANGVACNSISEITAGTPECDRVREFYAAVNNSESTGSLIFLAQLLNFVVLLFLLGSSVHRASRNLRPLKAEGQLFTPGWSVAWLFIPIANFWQALQVLGEIWLGSDPKRPPTDTTSWHLTGRSPLISFWWLTVVASALLSPPLLTRLLASGEIEARIGAANFLVWSDVLMVLPAIVGIILFRAIHGRQEARFAAVGPNQVLPVTAAEVAEARRQRAPGARRR